MKWALRCTVVAALLAVAPARAAERLKEGDALEALATSKVTYRDVRVRSVGARSVTITHAGGMASVPLRDLTPELQERFGFDPQAVAATPTPSPPVPKPEARVASPSPAQLSGPRGQRAHRSAVVDQLLPRFGEPAKLAPEVNLRPRFAELGIGVRDQGARPSCAVFAVVCALEFQSAQASGKAQNFSEEYLIWATRKTTQRVPETVAQNEPRVADEPGVDLGFVLADVVMAIRGYGIAVEEQMPHKRAKVQALPAPPPDLVEAARNQRHVGIHIVPGRDTRSRIVNIIHALNSGLPVPIGVAWPHWRTVKSGFLNAQKPVSNSWHAVTVVGYRCPSGNLEDAQFIFKNSWGSTWGQGGYGTATFHYLQQHLGDAILLELQAPHTG